MANISEKLNEAFNIQIREELESGYIYLGMAAWFEERSLGNLATWFDKQAAEEFAHAMKLKSHILERGGSVHYQALAEQKQDWNSIMEIVEATLEHEQHITKKIIELYELAQDLKEYSSYPLLLWFIEEQVEEEDNASSLIDKLKGYKNDFNFDHHIERVEE
ncbi:MAG: ferritin [Candidatus Heimdallarchaeota archaeon]|nr:ferritin [Candidatus Heimdallarchaeota archaeon]